MLDQKLRLLFASTTVQAEIHVQLDGVHAREPISKFSGTVEDATGVCIVGFRRHHQHHIRPFSNCLYLKVVSQALWRHIEVRCGNLFSHIPLVRLQSARERESTLDTLPFATFTKKLSELRLGRFGECVEYATVVGVIALEFLREKPEQPPRFRKYSSFMSAVQKTVFLESPRDLKHLTGA